MDKEVVLNALTIQLSILNLYSFKLGKCQKQMNIAFTFMCHVMLSHLEP